MQFVLTHHLTVTDVRLLSFQTLYRNVYFERH